MLPALPRDVSPFSMVGQLAEHGVDKVDRSRAARVVGRQQKRAPAHPTFQPLPGANRRRRNVAHGRRRSGAASPRPADPAHAQLPLAALVLPVECGVGLVVAASRFVAAARRQSASAARGHTRSRYSPPFVRCPSGTQETRALLNTRLPTLQRPFHLPAAVRPFSVALG